MIVTPSSPYLVSAKWPSTSPNTTNSPNSVWGMDSVKSFLQDPLVCSFIGGGAAGAVSRTVVSPFERMKIIFQVQQHNNQYVGVLGTLKRMWTEEGWRGFMRGNGSNCIRVIPYSAVQFCTYTYMKALLGPECAGTWEGKVGAGVVAGVVSVATTYPLDLVRTRLSVQTAQISNAVKRADIAKPPGMFELLVQMYKHEGGIRALYRGLVPTTLGVGPYVGINFAAYEVFRDKVFNGNSVLAGAVSGGLAQSITYPFDILRRRFQVKTLSQGSLGYAYTGTWDGLRSIVQKEGFRGLYKGYIPHTLKVVPSMAASFWTFETVRKIIKPRAN